MVRCPQCGSENIDEAKFCQRCAAPLGAGVAMAAPPVQAKKNNTMTIVIVVIVVVVALIIAGALISLYVFNNAVHNTSDLSMTVSGTHVATASEYSTAPSAGSEYLQVTVVITNHASIPTSVSPLLFTLKASGTDYGYTPWVTSDTSSGAILAGGSSTVKVSFMIPVGATPEKITYAGFLGNDVSADI